MGVCPTEENRPLMCNRFTLKDAESIIGTDHELEKACVSNRGRNVCCQYSVYDDLPDLVWR